jgi:hypothetical protein
MGKRKVVVMQSVADSIADVAWFIESKGLPATAEKFSDSVYDYFEQMSDERRIYSKCKDTGRAFLGFKCVPFRKKYTIVFIETTAQITICEFLPSKLIK